MKQAQLDKGERPALTTNKRERSLELKRENRELRRANEISRRRRLFAYRTQGRSLGGLVVFAGMCSVRLFEDDHGRSFDERGLDHLSPRRRISSRR